MNDFLIGAVKRQFSGRKRSSLNVFKSEDFLFALRRRNDLLHSRLKLRNEPYEDQSRAHIEDRMEKAYSVKHRTLQFRGDAL